MADNDHDSVRIPTFSVKSKADDRTTCSDEIAAKGDILRSLVTRLQRRAHEMYVECNYGNGGNTLPSSLFKRINQLKDDADILLMLIDGENTLSALEL